MINLWNTHLNKEIKLLGDSNLSFSCENQLQDLENYTLSYTFDIEVLNDEAARDAVSGVKYADGEYEALVSGINVKLPIMKSVRVLVTNNAVPMFIGDLSLQSSSVTSIKCSLKCVPYGEAFKDFSFRDELRGYMTTLSWEYGGKFVESIMDYRNTHTPVYVLRSNSYNSQLGYVPSVTVTNENQDTDAIPASASSVTVEDVDKGWTVKTDSYNRAYWSTLSVNEILSCMNIHINKKYNDRTVMIPNRISYDRMLKVRMYKSTNKETKMQFKPTTNSEIWWKEKGSNTWELLEPLEITSGLRYPFAKSIRKCKGLDGLTFKYIEYPIGFTQFGILGYNTSVAYQGVEFGIPADTTYEDGDTIDVKLENVDSTAKQPDYVDVIFEYECSVDTGKMYEHYRADKDHVDSDAYNLYMTVPFLPTDLEFFSTSTGTFLNELSLNNKDFRWLRNPGFINSFNYDAVHGQDSPAGFGCFSLTNDNLQEVKREIDYTKPSELQVKFLAPFTPNVHKLLNSRGNDTRQVEHTFGSIGICHLMDDGDSVFLGAPPLVWDKANEELVENSISGVFTITNTQRVDDVDRRLIYFACSPDWDYLDDYTDKSNKYTFKVTGYNFQEWLEYEGVRFSVDKWSTSDFGVWELECYPVSGS